MEYLRQSTASQEISIGYFLDSTDGNTEETGLSIANTDIKIRKGGTTTLANKNSGGATHISNGVYSAVLDATDSNTLGMLEIYVHVAGALATKNIYMVLPAASYDALITNGLNDIAATAIVSGGAIDTTSGAIDGVTLVATTTTNTDMRGTDSAATATALATVDGNVDAILADTDELQSTLSAGIAARSNNATLETLLGVDDDASEDTVIFQTWEEVNTGNTHNGVNTTGRQLRELAAPIFFTGTAQSSAGLSANQIKLPVSASSVDNTYDPGIITIIEGTGDGQSRLIVQYEGATRIATLNRDLVTIADVTSEITVTPSAGGLSSNEGLLQGATINTADLNDLASSVDGTYVDQIFVATGGTGQDQSRLVIAYDGGLKRVTFNRDLDTTFDTTTSYYITPANETRIDGNLSTLDDLNNITAADVLAAGDIDGFSLEDAQKIALAALAGKLSGAATSTNTIQAADDSKARITATVDAAGNRSAVTLDGTG